MKDVLNELELSPNIKKVNYIGLAVTTSSIKVTNR